MSLGQSLRSLRKNRNMTLAELASRVGSHVGNLSRIERDAAKPSLDLLYKISEALDYRLADIFDLTEPNIAKVSQSALNAIFISLLEKDQELLLEFAKLLQARQMKPPDGLWPTLQMLPIINKDTEEQEIDSG